MGISDTELACRSCGYSLVGLTNSVCPECGVRVPDRDWHPSPPRIGQVMMYLVLSTGTLVAIALAGATRSGDPFKAVLAVCGSVLACGVSAIFAGWLIIDKHTFKEQRRECGFRRVVHAWCVLLLAITVVSGLLMLW